MFSEYIRTLKKLEIFCELLYEIILKFYYVSNANWRKITVIRLRTVSRTIATSITSIITLLSTAISAFPNFEQIDEIHVRTKSHPHLCSHIFTLFYTKNRKICYEDRALSNFWKSVLFSWMQPFSKKRKSSFLTRIFFEE